MLELWVIVRVRVRLGPWLETCRIRNAWIRKNYGTKCLEVPLRLPVPLSISDFELFAPFLLTHLVTHLVWPHQPENPPGRPRAQRTSP